MCSDNVCMYYKTRKQNKIYTGMHSRLYLRNNKKTKQEKKGKKMSTLTTHTYIRCTL